AALLSATKDAAAIGGAINDMGDKTGESSVKLSNLRGAAIIAGSSLDEVANGMFKFSANMAEGSDKFVKGMERIGVSVEDIKAESPGDQFITIASAIRNVEDPAERAAAAVELFGKQGRDLLPLMQKPLEDLIAKSRELGSTWTDEETKSAETFEQQLNAL